MCTWTGILAVLRTQYPPGSSGNSDWETECQDTRRTQRVLSLDGRCQWERLRTHRQLVLALNSFWVRAGTMPASLHPADSWSASLFSLPAVPQLSALWMTVPSALCSRGCLTSLHWLLVYLTDAFPQPSRRKQSLWGANRQQSLSSLLNRTLTQNKSQESQAEISFSQHVLKTRLPQWTGSFGVLQTGIVVIMGFKWWAHCLIGPLDVALQLGRPQISTHAPNSTGLSINQGRERGGQGGGRVYVCVFNSKCI